MSSQTFFIDGTSVEIQDGWRQRVLFDNVLVSDVKVGLRPRLRVLHRFAGGNPPRHYEVSVFQGISFGYLATRDGELVKAHRPSYWPVVFFGLALLINLIDYAAEGKTKDLVSVVVWGMAFAVTGASLLAWSRAKRQLTGVPQQVRGAVE